MNTKNSNLGIVCICFFICFGITAGLNAQVYTSTGVAISSEVDPIVKFNVMPKTFTGVALSSITYGSSESYDGWMPPPDQYIEIEIEDNWWNWKVEVYTNNFWRDNQGGTQVDTSTTTWGISFGGMIESTTTPKRIAMAWAIRQSTSGFSGMEASDAPGVVGSSWTFVMDKSDKASTTVSTGTVQGTQWDNREGYATIMYGNAMTTTIIRPDFSGSEKQEYADSPVAFVVAAEYPAATGNYKTRLWFDLLHY